MTVLSFPIRDAVCMVLSLLNDLATLVEMFTSYTTQVQYARQVQATHNHSY